jgi:adenine-specific DNA-methyltransferase
MDGKSLNITEEKLNHLKKIIPEAFAEGKIDWEKLKATLGEDIEFKNERYVLNWAGKSDAFQVLQSPTTSTLVSDKEESVNFDDTENIFIEGENLEVLKVLQKSYFGKIKMIYIDPPYNTGNDKFIYPDKFSETKEEYLSRIGDKDESGYLTREGLFRTNSSDNGHYHSNWLSMMYPRLFLARNLLQEDGVIFVSIDDNEVYNLRLLMNEVFGEENFVATFIWEKRTTRENRRVFSFNHDFIVCYARSKELFETSRGLLPMTEEGRKRYTNPDNDPRGDWQSVAITAQAGHGTPSQFYDIITPGGRKVTLPPGNCWRVTEKRLSELIEDNRIWFGKDGNNVPRIKKFLSESKEGLTPHTLWKADEVGTTDSASKALLNLFGGESLFETPKPIELIKRMTAISAQHNCSDIVLDFFAGSATTAHAVLDLNKEDGGNRKFITVQLPEKCDESSEAFKAGYDTIAEIGKERIRRAIKKIKTDPQTELGIDDTADKQDLGFKVFKLQQSNFKIWRSDVKTEEELVAQLTLHTDPVDENATIKNILYELLLKSGVPLTARIEERGGYYLVNNGEIALILKKIDESIIEAAISEQPQKVITLDRLFENNDQLKTNTALQMKDGEIDFRVV